MNPSTPQKEIKKKYMAELESVLFTDELEISVNKNKHASNRTRKLAINGDDEMLALLKKRAISQE